MVPRRPFLWISLSAAAAFALYASLFLCFFVDDEAIPLVYARNLLRGRGLVYTVLEGRVEGYSDFLHVLWSAAVLRLTTALGLSNLAPLAIGKAVSFLAGVTIVLLTARMMRRSGVSAPGLAAGLAFLALSGPLAIWSCSSLEAAVFALMVTALASVLFIEGGGADATVSATGSGGHSFRLGVAMALGIAMLFERIDGFIYLGTLLAAAMLTSDRHRRRALLTLSLALAVIGCAYCAWRYAYFGSLLPTPLAAKVLYRFSGVANDVVNAPEESYLRSLLAQYGIAWAAVLATAVALAWRLRTGRAAVISVIALSAYVGVVGDWMFGWRFVVALLPLTALIIALGVTRLPNRFAWIAAAVILVWSGTASHAFVTAYVGANRWPIFWTRPRSDVSAWLRPYGDLLASSKGLISAGDRVAYNQAGIVPYALDLENIDDLGICSRFVARLPTTDIVYTGVGRYSPLRNQPVLETAQAYLLYQDVRFLISRTHLLRGANRGEVPAELLGGYFRHVLTDPSGESAIYRRTDKDASAYQRDPDVFTENLAHVSRLVRGSIGEEVVQGRDLAQRFGFLGGERTTFTFDTATQLNVQFATGDEDVFVLYIDRIAASVPTEMTVMMFNAQGREVDRKAIALTPESRSIVERFEPRVRARTVSIRFRASGGQDRVSIRDMRLEGQSATLREYVRRTLQFRN